MPPAAGHLRTARRERRSLPATMPYPEDGRRHTHKQKAAYSYIILYGTQAPCRVAGGHIPPLPAEPWRSLAEILSTPSPFAPLPRRFPQAPSPMRRHKNAGLKPKAAKGLQELSDIHRWCPIYRTCFRETPWGFLSPNPRTSRRLCHTSWKFHGTFRDFRGTF